MSHISIRDLQKMSAARIEALEGTTPVKSGNRTIALLTPLKPTNIPALRKALKRAKKLARGRDPKIDDAALAAFGEVDPVDYSHVRIRRPKVGR